MGSLSENKIVLVKRKTRLDDLIARYNTMGQARFHIEHAGSDFSDYVEEDRLYRLALAETRRVLESFCRVQVLERSFVPHFIFGPQDTVVALGQDGLVANTLKYLSGQPLLGVNPDPARWDGVLLPFQVQNLRAVIPEALAGKRPLREVTMAQAALNDGQVLYAVNDLFIGQKTHVSSRYRLQLGGQLENQSSSGIIVSTGLGSTGWLKSVLTGAAGIAGSYFGHHPEAKPQSAAWNSSYLYYSVREPFPSKTSGTSLIFGKVSKSVPLKLQSYMPENGVIFSDGVEQDFLQFNAGAEATVTPAEKKGFLVF